MKVAVRARPLSESEKSAGSRECIRLDSANGGVDAGHGNLDRKYDFDFAYPPEASQKRIFEETTVPLLNRVFEGKNATILAYGQVLFFLFLPFLPSFSNFI